MACRWLADDPEFGGRREGGQEGNGEGGDGKGGKGKGWGFGLRVHVSRCSRLLELRH